MNSKVRIPFTSFLKRFLGALSHSLKGLSYTLMKAVRDPLRAHRKRKTCFVWSLLPFFFTGIVKRISFKTFYFKVCHLTVLNFLNECNFFNSVNVNYITALDIKSFFKCGFVHSIHKISFFLFRYFYPIHCSILNR